MYRGSINYKIALVVLVVLIICLNDSYVNIAYAYSYIEPDVTFDRYFEGPKTGQHKVPPTTNIRVTITASVSSQVENAVLRDYVPRDFSIIDTYGGTVRNYDLYYNVIEWSVGAVNESVSKSYLIYSPERTTPATKYYFSSELSHDGGAKTSSKWMVIVADPDNPHYYNFSNTTNNNAYKDGSVTGGSYPPIWTDCWGGTVANATEYSNLNLYDGIYGESLATTGQAEPFWRFNFTIHEDNIYSIYIKLRGLASYGGVRQLVVILQISPLGYGLVLPRSQQQLLIILKIIQHLNQTPPII